MRLSVTCPRCESKYQLDAEMRGKRMRCPNTICRAVFEVRDDSDPLPGPGGTVDTPPVVGRPSDRVTDPPAEPPKLDVPPPGERFVLQTKSSAPPRSAAPPSPVTPPAEPPKRKPVPVPLETTPGFADDFPGDAEPTPTSSAPALATEAWQPETWENPPVRETTQPSTVADFSTAEPAPRRRKRAVRIMAGMLLLLGVIFGFGVWRVRGTLDASEAEIFQKAEALYQKPDFAEASAAFQKLHREFPESSHSKKYRFLAELSDVRASAYARESAEETVKALERVLQVIGVYRGDALLKERDADLWQTLGFLATELTELAEREKKSAYLTIARRAWTEAKKHSPPPGTNQAERERKLSQDWSRIEAIVAAHGERQQLIAEIQKHQQAPSALGVKAAWELATRTKRGEEPEIRQLLTELHKRHRERIRFVSSRPDDKQRTVEDDELPSLSVTPRVMFERKANVMGPPILALARGVLYALDPTNGDLRWARRVGIDTHHLPLRIPADAITPELALVLSSDQRSVSAVVLETGATLWQTPLEGACLGAPVLVDRTLLVPTLAGKIEEIEIAEGRRLGAYQVDQPLPMGGVHLPGTSLVYFPGEEYCLYEFDVTKRICTNILYTRHPAGALLGLPAVYQAGKESWMLLCVATGLRHAAVRAYGLPIERAEQKTVEPGADLPGVSAYPWFGPDRFAILTDSGFLSPWGIRQPGTRDPLLFRQLKQDFQLDANAGNGRTQMVYADRYNYWPMTRGRLQRIQTIFDAGKGPDLVATWPQSLPLGSLLHQAQVRREPGGGKILYLTTQADGLPVCLATAIDAQGGKILWQRQLGVLPQHPPLLADGTILLSDAGGVLRFDSKLVDEKPKLHLRESGERLLPGPADRAFKILLGREKSYLLLSWQTGGLKLHAEVRSLEGNEKPRVLDVTLPASVQGTPVLEGDHLLVPLSHGIVVSVNIRDGALVNGPDWRAAGAEENARGFLAFVTSKEFILTDGSRGLARIASADGKMFDKRATGQLSHRVVRPPVVVPGAQGEPTRVCVLDASDTLTLVDADRLTVLRRWPMSGKVTAGPFVRSGRIGCVVGRSRLVWLDPARDEPIWAYSFAEVVGEPNLIDGVLVVGDVAGQFLALDPASGRPLGPGIALRANAAPTAAPLPFGPGRAFVPLTDGTILLLSLEKLR